MFRQGSYLVVLAFVFSLASTLAWDPLGHMLTAQIASEELTPKAREEMDAALARFNAKENPDAPYDVVTAACWMDDVRSRTKEYNEWHYVNLPFTHEGTPVPEGSATAPDVIWGIGQCKAIIKGETQNPAIDRDQAIMMLIHLVGDIHQPLHATAHDDAGGNKVKIANLKDKESDLIFSKGGNLHFFWDSAYRRTFQNGEADVSYAAPLYPMHMPVTGHRDAKDLVEHDAAEIRKAYPPGSAGEVPGGDASAWALESHALGYDLGYGKLPAGSPVRLDEAYVTAAQACAQKRIALAGYRLGALLNSLLDPSGK